MTDKDRDLTPQGNAPSWVDEVLASPAVPRPVEGRHGGVSDVTPGSAAGAQRGWESWPPNDPARDLRLPEDPPRPAAPTPGPTNPGPTSPGPTSFDADDWVARATGGQARNPRMGGTQTTTYAAAPQMAPRTDAWGEPLPGGALPTRLPLDQSGDTAQKKLIAGLLGIFLGSLGVHKFYLGQNAAGLLMLGVNLGVWALAVVLSLFTLGFGAVVLFPLAAFVSSVLGVIGLIEGIIYLTKSDADFERDYLHGRKSWF